MGLTLIYLVENYYGLFELDGNKMNLNDLKSIMDRVSYYTGYTDYEVYSLNYRYDYDKKHSNLVDYLNGYSFWLPSKLYILEVVSTFQFEMYLQSQHNCGNLLDVKLKGIK